MNADNGQAWCSYMKNSTTFSEGSDFIVRNFTSLGLLSRNWSKFFEEQLCFSDNFFHKYESNFTHLYEDQYPSGPDQVFDKGTGPIPGLVSKTKRNRGPANRISVFFKAPWSGPELKARWNHSPAYKKYRAHSWTLPQARARETLPISWRDV